MWDCRDNQEVGLEAAILERVRNSSLVKWSCADNVAGLSTPPKLCHSHVRSAMPLRGCGAVVWVGRGASIIR